MQVTVLIAAFVIVMAAGPTEAGLPSSVVNSETTVATTLNTVIDATTEVNAETSAGTTPDNNEEVTSDSTATVWVPPPGLLSDETIASISAGLSADTAIATVDVNADLNIGSTVNRVSEPGTILLVGIGLAALITTTRQKARKRQGTINRENL